MQTGVMLLKVCFVIFCHWLCERQKRKCSKTIWWKFHEEITEVGNNRTFDVMNVTNLAGALDIITSLQTIARTENWERNLSEKTVGQIAAVRVIIKIKTSISIYWRAAKSKIPTHSRNDTYLMLNAFHNE